MKTHSLSCDPVAIDRYLAGRLSLAEESAFEAHLETCDSCRRTLDQSAADERLWNEASRFLSVDEWDGPASLSRVGKALPAAGGSPDPVAGPAEPAADRSTILRRLSGWLDPTDDPHMLGRFGGYEIAGVIGEGGMGIVLKGFESTLNRYVAIKVLAPHLASNGAARQRFSREARAAAAVLHENVIAIHRVDESQGLPYLVMPYITGASLQKRLDREGPLPLATILRIGRQIAAGLTAAHAQGLVHRDVKPANILLERGVDRVTLTDFGLARAVDDATVTRSGIIAGTPQYMSPEQARGEPVDVRSDLFSLGSVLYAMCAGRPPFRAPTAYGILRRISDDSPRPIRELNPDIPDWLCAIVGRLHAKDRADRWQTADEVAHLFEQCLAHVQQPTAMPLPESLRLKPTSSLSLVGRILNPFVSSSHRDDRAPAAAERPGHSARQPSHRAGGSRIRSAVRLIAPSLLLAAAVLTMIWTRPPSTEPDNGHASPVDLSYQGKQNGLALERNAVSVSPSAGMAEQGTLNEKSRAAPTHSAATRWNDGVAAALEALTHDVTEQEDSVDRIWGDPTAVDNAPPPASLSIPGSRAEGRGEGDERP
ncbi:MAG: protein kinase domain-containing protein [Planctomycetaceae bacterium]